jgi:hypothetical protein
MSTAGTFTGITTIDVPEGVRFVVGNWKPSSSYPIAGDAVTAATFGFKSTILAVLFEGTNGADDSTGQPIPVFDRAASTFKAIGDVAINDQGLGSIDDTTDLSNARFVARFLAIGF